MLRFAANVSMLYPDLPFLDRFEAAAADGFTAVECQFPYAWPASEIATRLAVHGLEQVLINTPASSVARGVVDRGMHPDERGLACLPGREDDFREAFSLALEYATALNCPRIHAMAGMRVDDVGEDAQRTTFVSNLRWACERLDGAAITIVIEPINTRDTPRYFLNRQDDAHAIVEAVGSAHLKVLMDLYHCQVVEGDVATRLRHWLPTGTVGHLQIAGVPERQEPDRGELDHRYLFDVIDAIGWDGWIGCEYRPADAGPGGTSAGLAWLRRVRC
jgi:hydroxypyruvate isomerase